MARLVSNSPSIQITIFGNITSSALETLGTSDITSLNNSGLISDDIFNQDNPISNTQFVSTTIAGDTTQVVAGEEGTGSTQQIANILQETEIININNTGQSFYQIVTQQPNKFLKTNVDIDGTPNNKTSSKVTIEWNFDNILVKNENLTGDNYVKYSNEANTYSILPYIKNLYIDISSNLAITQKREWINLATIDVSANYDTDVFKNFIVHKFKGDIASTDIESILKHEDKRFDIRVYASNDALEFPTISQRALIYKNCRFLPSTKPSKPLYAGNNIVDNSCIKIFYRVDETEIGSTDPDTKIDRYLLIFNEYDTLASSYINYTTPDGFLTENLPITYGINEDIEISLNSIRSGTKYNAKVQLRNNIKKDEFSTQSDEITTFFSKIPKSDPSFVIDLSLDIIGSKKFIRNKVSNGSEELFLNIKDPESKLNYETHDYQYIEISKPEYDYQETDVTGYGKFIDDVDNLVKLEYYINDELKQDIVFPGFNMNLRENKSNGNTTPFFHDLNKQDMYEDNGDNKLKGFRIAGKFKLKNITNNFENIIGPASSDPYKIELKYSRHEFVDYKNISKSFNVYIDNFNSLPSLYKNIIDFDVKLITYNMGLPSVKAFSFIFDKGYLNVNSINMIINGDGIIGTILPIDDISCDISKNIILNNYEINQTGMYDFNNVNFQNKVQNYYSNIHYNKSLLTRNNEIKVKEILYNIFYLDGEEVESNFLANHYCDYNSFSKDENGRINVSKLDLDLINIYQFQNIQVFNYNMKDLKYTLYFNHGSAVSDQTLLYINGGFNGASIYPTITNYEFNNISFISDAYSFANVSYNLNGFRLNNNNGYKWITFRIQKLDATTFKFNDNNSKLINTEYKGLNNKGPKYIPFSNLNNFNELDTLFPDEIINRLSDENDNSVIGFCEFTDIYDVKKISLFNKKFSKNNNWMTHGTLKTNLAFLYLLTYQGEDLNKWGSLVYDHERSQYGMYVDPNLVKDYLYISVGIKNNLVI